MYVRVEAPFALRCREHIPERDPPAFKKIKPALVGKNFRTATPGNARRKRFNWSSAEKTFCFACVLITQTPRHLSRDISTGSNTGCEKNSR
jgi:hypothetical protein